MSEVRVRHEDGPGSPRHLSGRARRIRDNYGLVLIWMLATLVVIAALGDLRVGRVLGVVLIAGAFILTLWASSSGRRGFLVVVIAVVVALVAAIVAGRAGAATTARAVSILISLCFVVVSPVVIARRLVRQPEITMRTVLGALCIYLFISLFFALLYSGYELVSDEPFFKQIEEPSNMEFVYFSITTITTLGYGDLSPLTSVGRMTAVIEAVLGQFYLVTVIAILIANLGRRRNGGGNTGPAEERPEHRPETKT